MILEPIYEVDFSDASYAFRPGRSCHAALATLGQIIATKKVSWINDADIKGFFDNVSHERLVELLQQRVSDPRMLELIVRFLKCGVMIEGRREATDDGVPQGACLSPLLAGTDAQRWSVYLHYVFDRWFENDVKPRLRGEAYFIRYADDFICAFECESDARAFQSVLPKRLGRFSLEVAEEKTKLLRFGRFAERDSTRCGEGAPGTFDFLGFTHYCGHARSGRFKLKRRTSTKKLRAKLSDLKSWFYSKLTTPIEEVWSTLNAKLCGHYQYYGINDNWPSLMVYRQRARCMARRHLSRRSQKTRVSWEDFNRYLTRHGLATPKQLTDLIAMGRAAGNV